MAEQYAPRRNNRSDVPYWTAGRFLAVVASVLTAGLVGFLLWQHLVTPSFQVKRIVVRGDVTMSESEIVQQAGISGRELLFRVDLASMERRLETHPIVRSAIVKRVLPNTLVIELQRRRPVLLALVNAGTTVTPITIDSDGVVVTRGADVEHWELPILSGLDFRATAPGTKLPSMLVPLLQDLRSLQMNAPQLFDMFSELRIDPRRGGGFDVIAFPKHVPVRVRLNDRLDRETCGYMAMVLDVLNRQGAVENIEEIDFRAGEVVYRMKEDSGAR